MRLSTKERAAAVGAVVVGVGAVAQYLIWVWLAFRAMRALEIIASPACGCVEQQQEEKHRARPELESLLTEVK